MVRKFFRAATGLACLALFSSAAVAQVGDDCSTAPVITDSGAFGVPVSYAFDTTVFTAGVAETWVGCNGTTEASDGVWIYTASLTGVATFSTCPFSGLGGFINEGPGGSGFNDNTLAIFDLTNCPLVNGTEMGCSDTSTGCGSAEADLSFSVTAGTSYYILNQDWWGQNVGYTGALAVVVNAPIGNDDPCTATPLCGAVAAYCVNAGLSNVGSTTGALNTPTCNGNNSNDVWYTYTPSTTGVLVCSTCTTEGGAVGTIGFHALTIWDDQGNPCTGAFKQLGCNLQDWRNLFACGGGQATRVKANVNAGQTYYVSVIGFLGNQGTYDIAVGEFAHSAGDGNGASGGAISIPGGAGNFIDTSMSDVIASDVSANLAPPTCMGFAFAPYGLTQEINGNFTAAYFSWTCPCQGGVAILSNCATTGFFGGNDTCLDVYDNDPTTTGLLVGCNDDAGAGPCGAFSLASFLQFAPSFGTTYFIRQGGWQGDQGPITFDLLCKYAHKWTQPLNAGDIVWESVDAPTPAGGVVEFNALTLDIQHPGLPPAVAFPNGWFFGVPLGFIELIIEAGSGTVPFWDYTTTGQFTHFTGGPGTVTFLLGAQLQSVGVALDPATGFASVLQTTDPTGYVITS